MVVERSEIDEEYKWKVKSLFEEGEWQKELQKVEEEISEIESYRGDLDSSEKLFGLLELRADIMRRFGKLASYASMRADEDTREQKFQALSSRTEVVGSKISAASSFIQPEIQNIGEERLKEMIENNSDLALYEHYLMDVMRGKPHTLSKEVENVMSELSEVMGASSEAYSMLSNADMEFPEVEKDGESIKITQSNFTKLLQNKDREFRREVYEKFYDRFSDFENTIGSTFSKSVRTDVKVAELRDYESSRHRALFNSNIPGEVYDNLVQTVRENLDVLHRHVELKEKALGVEKLGMHDVYVPLAQEPVEISFEDAKEHVLNSLEPMGEEYCEIAENAFEERWIDVYENKGKRSGAYSGGSYDTPPFILMNYQEDVSSMYTLAHELGHSMHSYFTTSNQPYIYGSYTIFVAEVASTVNEALLTQYLLENVEDDNLRAHVLNHALENFRNTLFRQTLFADFEQRVHGESAAGKPLTPDRVSEIYGGLKEEFYEPAVIDDRIRTEWMRIPHFYRAFYVYQYATGISAAVALSRQIINEGPEDYLEFLKSGSSMYPLDLLKLAGVDMSSPKPVQKAIDIYSKRLEQMEKLV